MCQYDVGSLLCVLASHCRMPPDHVFITLFTQISAQVLNEGGLTGFSRDNTSHVLSIDKDLEK